MDEFDPTTLTRTLDTRHSRRHALKLLAGATAGGALALGARSVPETLALTAHGQFATGWTHLAGTTTGLLFYRTGGVAAYGTFVDGSFAQAGLRRNFTPDCSQIVGATRSLFFHRASDALGASGYLDANGVFVQPFGANYHIGSGGGTVFPGTRRGRFLLYAPDTGYLAPVLRLGLSPARSGRSVAGAMAGSGRGRYVT